MPKLKSYHDMIVEVLEVSPNPAAKVGIALSITMKSDPNHIPKAVSKELCDKLIKAVHHSVFEHVQFTFLIQNVSRSFLAQITRQRTAKPTSGSQHYQDYRNYNMMVHPEYLDEIADYDIMNNATQSNIMSIYTSMIDDGIPKEEARQVLPNACAVNYLWTIDARNLMYFLNLRLCNRNVYEMRLFSSKVLLLAKEHFPELFNNVGPQCEQIGGCQQHLLNMQCEQKYLELL